MRIAGAFAQVLGEVDATISEACVGAVEFIAGFHQTVA
jgi:hypothetical protein